MILDRKAERVRVAHHEEAHEIRRRRDHRIGTAKTVVVGVGAGVKFTGDELIVRIGFQTVMEVRVFDARIEDEPFDPEESKQQFGGEQREHHRAEERQPPQPPQRPQGQR